MPDVLLESLIDLLSLIAGLGLTKAAVLVKAKA